MFQGWDGTTRTLLPWRQGFRHPTRNECMGWFAQIHISRSYGYNPLQPQTCLCELHNQHGETATPGGPLNLQPVQPVRGTPGMWAAHSTRMRQTPI